MIIEIILVLLGILTTILGIWNLFIGSYIWGVLFLIGGIWSMWLGTMYIIQIKTNTTGEPRNKNKNFLENDEKEKDIDEDILSEEILQETPAPEVDEIESAINFTNDAVPSEDDDFIFKMSNIEEVTQELPKEELNDLQDLSNLEESEESKEDIQEVDTLEIDSDLDENLEEEEFEVIEAEIEVEEE